MRTRVVTESADQHDDAVPDDVTALAVPPSPIDPAIDNLEQLTQLAEMAEMLGEDGPEVIKRILRNLEIENSTAYKNELKRLTARFINSVESTGRGRR